MKLKLELLNAAFDDNRLSDEIKSDIQKDSGIYIFKDENSWADDEGTRVYSLWLEYGKDKDNGLMFEVRFEDLELFANTLLKSIEIFRKDYEDVIKEKIKTCQTI